MKLTELWALLAYQLMTGRQRAKLAMFVGVDSLCSQYRHVWGQLPAFRFAFERFQIELAALTKLAQAQRRHTDGAAQRKAQSRLELCELAFEVGAAIRASALAVGDKKAASKLVFSLTQLRIGKDALCIERCRQIRTSAKSHQSQLESFGVSEQKINDLSIALERFAAKVVETHSLRAANKKITGQLPTLFKTVEEIVYDQLDNLIPQFRTTASRFYNQYQEIRVMTAVQGSQSTASEPEPEEPPLLD